MHSPMTSKWLQEQGIGLKLVGGPCPVDILYNCMWQPWLVNMTLIPDLNRILARKPPSTFASWCMFICPFVTLFVLALVFSRWYVDISFFSPLENYKFLEIQTLHQMPLKLPSTVLHMCRWTIIPPRIKSKSFFRWDIRLPVHTIHFSLHSACVYKEGAHVCVGPHIWVHI